MIIANEPETHPASLARVKSISATPFYPYSGGMGGVIPRYYVSGLPGQPPPTATFRIRKKGLLKTHSLPVGTSAGETLKYSTPSKYQRISVGSYSMA